jgi:hypothetical protein
LVTVYLDMVDSLTEWTARFAHRIIHILVSASFKCLEQAHKKNLQFLVMSITIVLLLWMLCFIMCYVSIFRWWWLFLFTFTISHLLSNMTIQLMCFWTRWAFCLSNLLYSFQSCENLRILFPPITFLSVLMLHRYRSNSRVCFTLYISLETKQSNVLSWIMKHWHRHRYWHVDSNDNLK